MLHVKISDLNWNNDVKHDMYAGVHENLPNNKSADIIFSKILPNHTLPPHWHTRPLDSDGQNNGYESFFFFQGGHILLILKNGEVEYNTTEPFTLTFFSGEEDKHGIKNLGDEPVIFQVLCAPSFTNDEEHM